jgi:hypothetical protein
VLRKVLHKKNVIESDDEDWHKKNNK